MFFDLFVESGGERDTWISNLALLLLQIGEMNKKNYEVCFFQTVRFHSFLRLFVHSLTHARTLALTPLFSHFLIYFSGRTVESRS